MNLKPMDPRITLKLLEGQKDVITPMAQERDQFYKDQSCPQCGGNAMTKTGDPNRLFRDGKPLAYYQLECDNCGCLFDPHTGLVIKMGNVANAFEPAVPLLEGPED
jgi:hypothetical protein